jgi:hypothetical protein
LGGTPSLGRPRERRPLLGGVYVLVPIWLGAPRPAWPPKSLMKRGLPGFLGRYLVTVVLFIPDLIPQPDWDKYHPGTLCRIYVVPHPTQTTVVPDTHALVGVVPSTTSHRNTNPERVARHMHGLSSSTVPSDHACARCWPALAPLPFGSPVPPARSPQPHRPLSGCAAPGACIR